MLITVIFFVYVSMKNIRVTVSLERSGQLVLARLDRSLRSRLCTVVCCTCNA